jgi:hypothetical protein
MYNNNAASITIINHRLKTTGPLSSVEYHIVCLFNIEKAEFKSQHAGQEVL